jgi:phosphohistidine swiveling domain-containing protein
MTFILGADPPGISIFRNGIITKYYPVTLSSYYSNAMVASKSDRWAGDVLASFDHDCRELVQRLASVAGMVLSASAFQALIPDLVRSMSKVFAYSDGLYLLSVPIEDILIDRLTQELGSIESASAELSRLVEPVRPGPTSRYREALLRSWRAEVPEEIQRSAPRDYESLIVFLNDLAVTLPEFDRSMWANQAAFRWKSDVYSDSVRTKDHVLEDLASELLDGPGSKEPVQAVLPRDFGPDVLGYLMTLRVGVYIKDEVSAYLWPASWYLIRHHWRELANSLDLSDSEFGSLTVDELARSGEGFHEVDLRTLARRRTEELAGTVYDGRGTLLVLDSDQCAALISGDLGEAPDLTVFRGRTASIGGGTVEGIVRVIPDSEVIEDFVPGEILIAPYTGYELEAVMRSARAVVTDSGGLLSHAAVVAREFGIPCVVGAMWASLVLKTGDRVRVDVETGEVHRTARS